MGNLFGKTFGKKLASAKTNVRILILGLDNAGKTSILYQLKLHTQVETLPTVGFNVETVRHKNLQLQMWDCGGQQGIRPLWRHYFHSTNGLIFVVDSSDKDRMGEAKDELHRIYDNPEMSKCPLLVIANKRDLPGAMNENQIRMVLKLDQLDTSCYHIEPCNAVTGDGLQSGLSWMAQNVNLTPVSTATLQRKR
ncbi:hypothetical protein HDU97_003171 [Phlyctochytrium planicorne]|nr:hypothetical protein HDU97_003171 [Phlyctochytrium planicorne]